MANKQKIDLRKFIPSELRNELNTSLTANLFNRFLAEEQSVFVSGQVGKASDPTDAVIHSNDIDRDLNALVPALYFKTGTDESVFSFDDLLNRMDALGVDIANLKLVLAEQSLNLAPPIDFDKLINYSNYYWTAVDSIAANSAQAMAWNPTNLPEYYTIARPSNTSTVKLPVTIATTRDVTLYSKDRKPEQVVVEFTDANTFTLTGSNGTLYVSTNSTQANVPIGVPIPNVGSLSGTKTTFNVFAPDLNDPHSNGHGIGDVDSTHADPLFSFSMTKGGVDFEAGDKFSINITYLSGSNTISFSPGPSLATLNKGFISNIIPFSELMYVDGVHVKIGDTVLVKNQLNAAENGVYTVTREKWSRVSNYSAAENFPLGTRIFVMGGSQAGKTFELTSSVTNLGVDALTFAMVAGDPPLAVNDWQVFNFWVHKDDLTTQQNVVQATRPIIEYADDLQLNSYFSAGYPSEVGTLAKQSKTRFNQIPQFDLFYYDGHHAKKTSGIFFYEEDPDYGIDSVLQRRVKVTVNADYVFGLGIEDEEGRLLHFKKANALKTVWAPGVQSPKASTITFNGVNDPLNLKGSLFINQIFGSADIQTWTCTYIGDHKFKVVGSRSGDMGVAQVATPFTVVGELTLLFTESMTPFIIGESFKFSISNMVMPRYVKKLANGEVVNIAGGPNADVDQEGTWLVPRRMFENLPRTLATEIAYGNLIDHCRSVIKSQDDFSGSSFGINNYRNIDHDLGLGGNIREHSSNFPLLASMLIQPGMSPLSIVDFAESQYAGALASVDQFLTNELANYIASTAVPITTTLSATNTQVGDLLFKYEELRAADQTLKDVFSDSTARIKNWPVTLPMMGVVPASIPTARFDSELGMPVIVHHDGHLSPLANPDAEFDRGLTRTFVLRSDGQSTCGTFSEVAPTQPYARELWFKPSTNQLFAFNVVSDGVVAPTTGNTGDFWYDRQNSELREWDVQSNTWALSTESVASRWVQVFAANIRNSLVLAIEMKLFESVHPSIMMKVDLSEYANDPLAQVELAKFSAKYGYDTYAPIFVSSDAFTWNYKVAFGQARWFDVYKAYFQLHGALPTERPDLEPWKLLGFANKPASWDAQYAGVDRLWHDQMWADIMAAKPGMKLCVNTTTDQLLPPYVSSALPESAQALTTTMPTGISNTFEFLDNGPVENVWRKSLEYYYGMSRIYFKRKPLQFVSRLWGDTFMSTSSDSIKVERNLMQPLSPSQFQLHGERLHNITSRTAVDHFTVLGAVGSTATASIRFEVTHVENDKTYFYAYINDVLKGTVAEGVPFSMSGDGVTFNNVIIDDMGIPFNLGDTFKIQYTATPDPLVDLAPPVDPEDCGCVLPGTNDTLPFPVVTITSVWNFIPALMKKFLGFGQVYTNLLRFNYIDVDMSPAANAYRGWDVRLAHRIGALIRGDSLQINTALGALPETAYNLILKRSDNLRSTWISALRIQLVQAGKRVSTSTGNYIPFENGDDWVFRLETYNPQHPLIEYYSYDLNGEFQTFNVLQQQSTKLPWKRHLARTQLNHLTTPMMVTGVQTLLTIIFGYVDRLEEKGFKINSTDQSVIDAETGRNMDWQLEVEKLVDRIYTNLGPGEGHLLNPFMQQLHVETPTGLLSHFTNTNFVDTSAVQAVYDVNGSVIPLNELFVVRTDEAATCYSNTPIFSAHVFIDEFEHVVLFNQRLSNEVGSSTIFDPFLGMRIDTAHMSYTRQAEIDRKPRFNGFVLSGHDVTRNIVSSVDSIANYYDASKTFNEPTSAKHALALLGFSSKSYFSDIGISDATQFNFWRGLIQAKGTNMSIDAFVNYKKFADASVDEYWAYKLAEYGDARPKNQPEIKIEQADAVQNFTQLQFYDAQDSTYDALPLFIQIEKEDDARWYSIDDLGVGLSFEAAPLQTQVVALNVGYYQLNNIFHNGDSGNPTVLKDGVATNSAVMVNANLLKVTTPGTYQINGYTWANPVKQSPVKLFDYQTSTMVKQIALWHPAIGIHAHEPLEIINTISKTDPALYNYSTKTTDNANLALLKPWGKKEVGRVWWNTDNLGYVPYYDANIFPNRNERNARWGSLAEWSTIDLAEWTESSVPPSLYDALALDEEGRSDIPVEVRASGKAAKKTFYKRDRQITIRPIAWSEAGVGDAASHPAFGSAFSTKVYYAGGVLFADAGRTASINLVDGRHFGGWLNMKPVGEVVITDQIVYSLGASTTLALAAPMVSDINVSVVEGGRFGQRIGQINLSSRTGTDGVDYLRMSDDFNFVQEVAVSFNGGANDIQEILFSDFGLKINAAGDADVAQIANDWIDVYVREGVRCEELIPLPDLLFVNDEADQDYLTHDYGWKSWNVPTQDDLTMDLATPRNTWLPYLGDVVTVNATAAIVKSMGDAVLTLKSGIPVARYSSSWTDWEELKTKKVERISDGVAMVSFPRATFLNDQDILDVNRLSIYSNGVQLNPQTYSVMGEVGQEVISIVNTLPEGTTALLIYRGYQPTSDELGFDPDVEDDPSVLTQFKADYQYTKVDVRNEAGVITSAKYYFWVQDKSVVQPNKSMSLVQAKSILSNGPSQFVMFARLNGNTYDSCVIAGLNQLVTNNDTYKLRFLRNDTLRDDPEQLSLKNTHTEWALIRRSQSSKIPKTLWDQLTNAASAQDAGGNPLPSASRIDYDLRNGTRTQFGFKQGQIFAATDLVRVSIVNTILNTALKIKLGNSSIPDYITALNFDDSDEWFADNASSRATMDLIWTTARPRQINEIFFEVLEDALASNYEFSDLFKTSLISVYSTTKVTEQVEGEISDGQF